MRNVTATSYWKDLYLKGDFAFLQFVCDKKTAFWALNQNKIYEHNTLFYGAVSFLFYQTGKIKKDSGRKKRVS